MPTVEEVTSLWRSGALVIVKMDAETMYRGAAFVFGDGDGLVWVEPSYLDPNGAPTPAEHRAVGAQLTKYGEAYNIRADGETWSVILAEYSPEEDADQIGDQMDFMRQQLDAAGTTWEAERERVRALVFGPSDEIEA
ncbi:hypothetical protein [Methyloversatilis sp. XJ19-49]|uniref:hypothetical protein n=1 Tax=Methyloversatilis sp. XJ19-49 TaxID=2963429 RepID=UPI00211CBB92|nr:hypothetical protein [Methyloversatilis sp. XJ19-49]MCQ9378816.1 hypothetical protein [Methyloversatilis sp. XJ19-49]